MKKEKLTIVVVTAVILIALGFGHYRNNATQFSQEVWKADAEKRKEMLNNIVDGNIFLGKSKTEVIEILGQPSAIETEKDGASLGRTVLKYDIEYDKIARLNLFLNLDLINDTVVMLYKHHEKVEKT